MTSEDLCKEPENCKELENSGPSDFASGIESEEQKS